MHMSVCACVYVKKQGLIIKKLHEESLIQLGMVRKRSPSPSHQKEKNKISFLCNYNEILNKMIPNLREEGLTRKQESNRSKASTIPSTSSTSRPRNPRILCVSRAFGSKDRHSKVFTVRGLRDRRIRLSVTTAIKFYDLQDRLGLNQPSKVVDWLLNVAKLEINKLPPLQIPPGSFELDHQQQQPVMRHDQVRNGSQSDKMDGLKINNKAANWDDSPGIPKSSPWDLEPPLRDKSKEITINTVHPGEKDGESVSSLNFFCRSNHSTLLNNTNLYNSFDLLDPSSFPTPQMGREDLHNSNAVTLPPTISPVQGCPPATRQPYFPSPAATSLDCDPKQIHRFDMLNPRVTSQDPSSSDIAKPAYYPLEQTQGRLHLSIGTKLSGSEDGKGSQLNIDGDFPSN